MNFRYAATTGLLSVFILCAANSHAQAGPYFTETDGNINGTTTCTAPLTRTINVSDIFIINDLNVGFYATHFYRGDIQATLSSPAGSSVTIIQSSGSVNADHYNVILDDEAANALNSDGNHSASAPLPYDRTLRPSGSLSTFDGEQANGTWTLSVCDVFAAEDNGVFGRADLFFTAASGADLALSGTTTNSTPDVGTSVTLTYTVTNTGPEDTSGVSVNVPLPSGLSHISDTGGGNYNASTGLWTIPGTIAANGSESLSITVNVGTTGPHDSAAEIATSAVSDPDSTPGNNSTNEDDDFSIPISPIVPPIPPLSCPAATNVLAWDNVSWTDGDMTNNYTVAGESITVTVADPGNVLVNNVVSGEPSPSYSTIIGGGFSPVPNTIHVFTDHASQSGDVSFTIDLGTPGTGVDKFQTAFFDVDFGTSQFQDKIEAFGYLAGNPVPVTYITGTANSQSGNVVLGQSPSDTPAGDGNLVVQFLSPVDQVVVNYGSGTNAPADPGVQAISMYDISFCDRTLAVIGGTKSTEIYDPAGLGLYAIPGNDVIYTITMNNSGTGAADTDSVIVIDSMPPEIEFYNGDIDDGGPFTDPVIGVDNGSTLTLDYANDVGYSDSTTKPTDFTQCNYTPAVGYDPKVNFICFNPSGAMAAGDPDPTFAVSFRARIK